MMSHPTDKEMSLLVMLSTALMKYSTDFKITEYTGRSITVEEVSTDTIFEVSVRQLDRSLLGDVGPSSTVVGIPGVSVHAMDFVDTAIDFHADPESVDVPEDFGRIGGDSSADGAFGGDNEITRELDVSSYRKRVYGE